MISVLLVDDEPALLDVTQIFLERDGRMKVTLSESGRDALEKLGKEHFDIIVADYEMPQMNGIDFFKEVKARELDIPVIIFTGRGREHVAIEALNLGAAFYLQKGGDPKSQFAELRNMIVQAVQEKRAEEETRSNQLWLQAVIDLYQMPAATEHDLCTYALEKAISLSGSRMGFLAFVNEEETALSIHSWSRSALEVCKVKDRRSDYPLEKTGLWGEPARQRRAVIANDYSGNVPGKRGYPEGHPLISKFLGVPVIDGSRVVMVIGLANKDFDYTEKDVQQVTFLMGSLWQVITRKREERELIESEKRFRSYFELPLAGIAVATPDLRWVKGNRKFCEMLGYAEDELVALSWRDLTPEEDWPGECSSLARVLSGDKPSLALEKRFRRKDGTCIDVDVSAMPARRGTGEVAYLVALVNDVSGKKQTEKELLASNEQMSATLEELRVTQDSLNEYCQRLEREEQALRKSEARFRAIVETAPSILLVMDREGQITYVSPNSLALTGYTPKEFQEVGFGIIHEKDAARVRDEVLRVVKGGTGFGALEFLARKKDGGTWYASGSMEPLQDEKGDLNGFLVQIVDVSFLKEAESELLQSRERLREIVETINDVVFSLDCEGKIVYASPVVTRALGFEPGELCGRIFADLLLPEDANEALREYDAFRMGRVTEPLVLEERVLTKGGEARWCRLSLQPIEKEGHFSGCTGTVTDIHDQKRAVEAMREREALLREIFGAVPVGIGLVKDGVLLSVNDSLCRMTGYTREELVGKSSRCLYPTEEEFEKVGEVRGSPPRETCEETVMGKWARKDGSEITVLISISPVDPRDRSSPVVFSVMDITGQEAQKAGLLENELLMRSFVDAIPGPAFLVGEGGEIVTANRAFWERHGKGAGCPPGTPITSLIDKETVQAIMDRVDDALRLGKRSRFEMAHSSSLLLVDICPVCDSQGVFSRAAVFCVDITDHKRAQETLAQYNRKLSLLCRVTRHDAGPLLAALRSYLDLMEKQTEDPLVHTYIHKEERNLDALENVLALAGDCQATGMQPPIWQDVSNVIRKVAGMHDLRNVTIYLDCSGLVILADPLLEKVFSVLIQNSLQHGGGVTRVSFSYRKEGDGVVLVCEDDGAGIAHDRKEVIFEGEEGENNGSGLFFAREILSMAGFSIRETGNPGEGARFEIGIPRGSFRVGTGGERGTE